MSVTVSLWPHDLPAHHSLCPPPILIKCLDYKLTCLCTQGLQVLIFDYMQPSFSLSLLFHAKGRNRFPEVAGIKHFRAGSSIISIPQVHYSSSRLITSFVFKEIGDLEGINKYIITLVQLHSCLILSRLEEDIHWIQLSRADCYTAGQLSSEVVPAVPSLYKVHCLQGNQNTSLSERQQWIYEGWGAKTVKLLNILFNNLRALQLLNCRIAAVFRAREISLRISWFVKYKDLSC